MSTPDLAGERKSYERGELEEDAAANEPLAQFRRWMEEAFAAKLPEPTAMTLATVGADGRPSTRVVLAKGVDEHGIAWYTNYESRKGQELAVHPFAALQFHWVQLERVVRIEGHVEKTSDAESDAYYATRPLDSRLGAWASPQSRIIADRGELERLLAETQERFLNTAPHCPEHWGGYRLLAERIEFWQGRPSRLHDRLNYRLVDGNWQRERLAP